MWQQFTEFMRDSTLVEFIGFELIICVIFFIILSFFANWIEHIKAIKKNSVQFGYGRFSQFKREFRRVCWDFSNSSPLNFSSEPTKEKMASKIDVKKALYIFNGYGMAMITPIDFLLAKHYVNKYIQGKLHPKVKSTKVHKKATYSWR